MLQTRIPSFGTAVIPLLLLTLIVAPAAQGQGQNSMIVKMRPVQKLTLGQCTTIEVTVTDAAGAPVVRPDGKQVDWQDFDLSFTAPAPDAFAWSDEGHRFLCARTPAATSALVVAYYPARHLAANQIVPGVTAQQTTEVVVEGAGQLASAASTPSQPYVPPQTTTTAPQGQVSVPPNQAAAAAGAGVAAGAGQQAGGGAAPSGAQQSPSYGQASSPAAAAGAAGQAGGGAAGAAPQGQNYGQQPNQAGGAAAGAAAGPAGGGAAGAPPQGQGYAPPQNQAGAAPAAGAGGQPGAGAAGAAPQQSYAASPNQAGAAGAGASAAGQAAGGAGGAPQQSYAGAPNQVGAAAPAAGAVTPTPVSATTGAPVQLTAQPEKKGGGGFFKKLGKHLKEKASEVTNQTAENLANSANQMVDATAQTGSNLVSGAAAQVTSVAESKVGSVTSGIMPSALKGGSNGDNLSAAVASGYAELRTMRFIGNTEVLDASGRNLVRRLADVLKTTPGKFVIQAHVDLLPSPADANASQILSERRAGAVKTALVAAGVDASRLTALGYGTSEQKLEAPPEGGPPSNARIVIAKLQQ